MQTYACVHVCVFDSWAQPYKAGLQAPNVKSSPQQPLLTSNVTNNFFLRLHCSNPFSGFWNGNIITFLWCSGFDKTAAC